MWFFPLSQLYSTGLDWPWCLLCASSTCNPGLCFNVCILGEEVKTKRGSKFSLLRSHLCSFSCMVASKFLVSPWYPHVHMKTEYLFSYGNLLTMQANSSGGCGAMCGKSWLVKVHSSSEVVSFFCVPSRGNDR